MTIAIVISYLAVKGSFPRFLFPQKVNISMEKSEFEVKIQTICKNSKGAVKRTQIYFHNTLCTAYDSEIFLGETTTVASKANWFRLDVYRRRIKYISCEAIIMPKKFLIQRL